VSDVYQHNVQIIQPFHLLYFKTVKKHGNNAYMRLMWKKYLKTIYILLVHVSEKQCDNHNQLCTAY